MLIEHGRIIKLEARIADLERQLADERARIDCATRGGWLSEDLECAGEDGPACWTHLLAEAQGVIDAKCTIAGCWKTKYEEAQGKLSAVEEMTVDWRGNPMVVGTPCPHPKGGMMCWHKKGECPNDSLRAENARLQTRVEEAEAQVSGMQEEGCAARGLVENIFNGLTTRGEPIDPVLAQMAEAAAKLLVEVTTCDHEALAERRKKALQLGCEHGKVMAGPQFLEWVANKLIKLGTTEGVGVLRAKADAERAAIEEEEK